MAKRINVEKQWTGRSYKKGGERVAELRQRAAAEADRRSGGDQ